MTEPDRIGRRRQPVGAGTVLAVAVLILAPIVALLWVDSYDKATPRLWGFPFFYWYQFLWVFIAATCTILAYLILTRAQAARRAMRDRDVVPAPRPDADHDGRSDR